MARKTRRRAKRLPFSKYAVFSLVISVFSLSVLFVSVRLGTDLAENISRIFAATGTICIFISSYNFIVSLKQISAHEYELFTRIGSLILSAASMVLWLVVYFSGLVVMFS